MDQGLQGYNYCLFKQRASCGERQKIKTLKVMCTFNSTSDIILFQGEMYLAILWEVLLWAKANGGTAAACLSKEHLARGKDRNNSWSHVAHFLRKLNKENSNESRFSPAFCSDTQELLFQIYMQFFVCVKNPYTY